jgi:hypothetical protein
MVEKHLEDTDRLVEVTIKFRTMEDVEKLRAELRRD